MTDTLKKPSQKQAPTGAPPVAPMEAKAINPPSPLEEMNRPASNTLVVEENPVTEDMVLVRATQMGYHNHYTIARDEEFYVDPVNWGSWMECVEDPTWQPEAYKEKMRKTYEVNAKG